MSVYRYCHNLHRYDESAPDFNQVEGVTCKCIFSDGIFSIASNCEIIRRNSLFEIANDPKRPTGFGGMLCMRSVSCGRSHSLTIWRTHTKNTIFVDRHLQGKLNILLNVDRLRRYPMYRHLKKSSSISATLLNIARH